jgi:hypothetical protein
MFVKWVHGSLAFVECSWWLSGGLICGECCSYRCVGQSEQGDRMMPLGFCDEISVDVFVQVPVATYCSE